ncbi:B2 bradykinin receptor-like [Poeciliopsis prolifica]|uniref:B2 bradykinin receptor-like n=1 Tax=Poeciliopsis prolifica TaxID=188132 RepID=UPI0024135F01|nr:B2 bradykinin receptor-like [Poeciliopsis prolifica]
MALLPTSLPANFTTLAEDGNQSNSNNCSLQSNNLSISSITAYILSISVLGIVLNIFVLTVFVLHKKPCTVAEIYLSNLAAADLFLVSFLPFWAANVYHKFDWIFGLAMCKMVNVSILMNVYCSIYFVVLISIDRYLALVHPLSLEKMRRPKFAKICCAVVWILGLSLSIPKFINRKLVSHRNITSCSEPDETLFQATEWMILVLGFFIPISIIFFCTAKILKALRNRSIQDVNAKKIDHKANALVLAVLLAFLICWVPFHLRSMPTWLYKAGLLAECSSQIIQHFCGQFFTYLAFFNSVANPILYVIVGKNFRKKVKEVFLQRNYKWSPTMTFRSSRTKLSFMHPS